MAIRMRFIRGMLWAYGIAMIATCAFFIEVFRAGPRNSVGSVLFGVLTGGVFGVLTQNYRRMIVASVVGALVANAIISPLYHTDSTFLAPIWSLPGALAGPCTLLFSSRGMKFAIGGSILGGELPVLICVTFAPMLAAKEIHIRWVSRDIRLLMTFLVVSVIVCLVTDVVDTIISGRNLRVPQDVGTQDAGTRSGRKVNRSNAAKRSNRRP